MPNLAKTEGEYYRRDGYRTEICFYEEDFVLSDEVPTLELARCVIQNGLLNERLRKIDGFKRWRTCEVVSFEPCSKPAESSALDTLLAKASSLGCIPENIDSYKRVDFKAKALERAIARAEAANKIADKHDAERGYMEA